MFTYSLYDEIGQGGFGKVFRGIQNQTGGLVAIKVLVNNSPDAFARFEREVRLLLRLQGPSIVRILDFNLDAPQPFIVLEYSEIGSAEKWIHDRQSPLNVVGMMATITHAVCSIHHAEGFHRDVKPGNILLFKDPSGGLTPKLSDLGLARTVDTISPQMTCGPYGTHGYMAPELYRGSLFTPHCDVYSLGITGIELLTGMRQPMSLFNADIPGRLRNLLLRMVSEDPAQRPDAQFALNEFVQIHQEIGTQQAVRRAQVGKVLFAGALAALFLSAISE